MLESLHLFCKVECGDQQKGQVSGCEGVSCYDKEFGPYPVGDGEPVKYVKRDSNVKRLLGKSTGMSFL